MQIINQKGFQMIIFTHKGSQEVRSKINNEEANYFFRNNCNPINKSDNNSVNKSQKRK